MIKKLYTLLVLLLAGVSYTMGQCSKTYPFTGVYPDTLPKSWEGVAYEQEIDFTFPTDTLTASIDSMKLKSVTGFPGIFSFTCGVSNCMYVRPSSGPFQGCVILKGAPPKGSAGQYKLYVEFEVYFQTIFGGQALGITDSSVVFEVQACNLTSSIAAKSDTAFCPGGKVEMEGPAGGYSYIWLLGQNQYMNLVSSSIQAMDSGTYYLVLTDTITGCRDTSKGRTVVFLPTPAKPSITINKTNPVHLNANAGSGLTYTWQYRDSSGNWALLTQTGDTLQNPMEGWYRVKAKNSSNCEGLWSDSVEYKKPTQNSISGFAWSSKVSLFPNPAVDQVQINLPSGKALQIALIDLQGKQILQTNSAGADHIILATRNLPRGNYIVRISDAKNVWQNTLILQ